MSKICDYPGCKVEGSKTDIGVLCSRHSSMHRRLKYKFGFTLNIDDLVNYYKLLKNMKFSRSSYIDEAAAKMFGDRVKCIKKISKKDFKSSTRYEIHMCSVPGCVHKADTHKHADKYGKYCKNHRSYHYYIRTKMKFTPTLDQVVAFCSRSDGLSAIDKAKLVKEMFKDVPVEDDINTCKVRGCNCVAVSKLCDRHNNIISNLRNKYYFNPDLEDLAKYDELTSQSSNNLVKAKLIDEYFSKKFGNTDAVFDGDTSDRALTINALKNCVMPLSARLRLKNYID